MAREVKDVVNIEVAYQITDQSLEAKQNGKESALANMISRQPEKYTECTLDWNPGPDFLYVNDKRFFWRFKRVRIEVMKYNGQRTEALGIGTMVEFADGTLSILHEVLYVPDGDLIYSSERGVEYDGISMTLCVKIPSQPFDLEMNW